MPGKGGKGGKSPRKGKGGSRTRSHRANVTFPVGRLARLMK